MKKSCATSEIMHAFAEMPCFFHAITLALAIVWTCNSAPATTTPAPQTFSTPVTAELLDADAFQEHVAGMDRAIPVKNGPRHLIWTTTTQPEWNGVKFGESKQFGPRHLRLAFKSPIQIGTVLVRGGGQLSVLKDSAPYPGRMNRDEDWLPAQRLKVNQVTNAEVTSEEYALWVLPPGIKTRALRFTHVPEAIDKDYSGWLGGVYVLAERFANIAPQAVPAASARNEAADKIINSSNDRTWSTWDNGKEGAPVVISPSRPEWIVLTWPKPVTLSGCVALWAGFGACEVQFLTDSQGRHPLEAGESEWKTLAGFDKIENQYPRVLGPNWLDFGKPITARAIKIRITQVTREGHPHLKGNTRDGKRVWLGELMALQPLGTADLSEAILPPASEQAPHPPIPIQFTLPEPGYVTLVIDDASDKRVRNLISATPFPAGNHTVWWDGMDDLLRDPQAARHGVYRIPERFVQPGTYKVRGLWRKEIDLRYEFSIYNAGNPAWETADSTGAWLANHTPPCAALFVPADRAPGGKPLIYLGSFVSEGGHGLAWVDMEGRKQGGVGWVGGTWTGARFLARDDGPQRINQHVAYVGSPWSDEERSQREKKKFAEIRLTAITAQGFKPVYKYSYEAGDEDRGSQMGGLAAWNGWLVFSLRQRQELVFLNASNTNQLRVEKISNPRGVAFDAKGRLLLISDKSLLRYTITDFMAPLPQPETVIPAADKAGNVSILDEPRQIALDSAGNIYISDAGQSHQVKVFTPAGKPLRTVGLAGKPRAGRYEPRHMNNPDGLTVDSQNRLWVAEHDYQPKRVSVWSANGQLLKAFYGPSEYGGGGVLDPQDKTRFYYHGMEFKLDWDKGDYQLTRVFWRTDSKEYPIPDGNYVGAPPERPFYIGGRRYFANNDNNNPTGGASITTLWLDTGEIALPVAAVGRANDWKLLKTDPFKARWPAGVNLAGDYWKNQAMFAWCDLNGDHQVQPVEVTMTNLAVGTVNVMSDLSLAISRVGTNAMRFTPRAFTKAGAPIYDISSGEILARETQPPASSGGDQALWHESGWTILTTPPKPYSPLSLGAVFKGEPRWCYPNPWPGLHASHESPPPSFPGMVIGATRLVGGWVTPRRGDAGPLWCINGNQGNLYMFTADGLFVAELFKDVRVGKSWSMPVAERGMRLNDLSLHDENFWPNITQVRDGTCYLVDGARTSLVRVDGLEEIHRLPESSLNVTAADLEKARAYFLEAESRRQQTKGRGVLKVAIRTQPPSVDGKLDDWADAEWVDVDKSGVPAYFNSDSQPHNVTAAMAVSGGRLYAAWKADDANLLNNNGSQPNALFKTGGALDIMLGTNPNADERRQRPAEGDVRLLLTRVNGKNTALLYRPVCSGAKSPVSFSSPWRTITFDLVEDVSAQVELAVATEKNAQGRLKFAGYEMSIPLQVLGLVPRPGLVIRGDIGILRGNGFQTIQRVYWCNKATGITADVPSEAELTPHLWGRIEFR